MSKILKLTLGTGETQEVTLESISVVSVRTRTNPSPGEIVDVDAAFTDVVAAEIVDAPEPVIAPPPADPDTATGTPVEEPTLASPAGAIEHAQTLPIEDAAAHVDAALVKFPGDPDLETAKAEIADIIDGDAWDGSERRIATGPRRVADEPITAADQRVGAADRRAQA